MPDLHRGLPRTPELQSRSGTSLIPLFGVLANLACMVFYLVGPFMGYGTVKEPLLALGVAAVWAIYGGIYFTRSSKASGRATLIESRGAGA